MEVELSVALEAIGMIRRFFCKFFLFDSGYNFICGEKMIHLYT